MSKSATDVATDKSAQGEIRCDITHASVSKKLKNTITVSLESTQTKESNETKVRSKDVEEKKKDKKVLPQNECVTDSNQVLRKDSIIKTVESLKNFEVKKEKKKTETTKTKIQTDTAATQTRAPQCKMIPIINKPGAQKPSNVAVPRKCPPLSMPLLTERPLVLTTHLVPSLPISLFEVLVEAIEVATGKAVVLLYEPRSHRPVAKEVADIAVLPADAEWENGELLPISFCFEHHLNKNNSPCIYADVIVAKDCAPNVQDITDLRGHRCSLPDRKKQVGAAALLFNYLYTRGESPAFFGNTLDADSQVATLQMVAGKQAEIGIIESPVIKCHKNLLPGIESVHTLTSLGPLPPYRIMVTKTMSDVLVRQITAYLLNIDQNKEWVDKFAPFGVTSFTKNSVELYGKNDTKYVATSVPYY